MASGRPVVGEKNRSTAIVPIRIPSERRRGPEDPRLSDVDEWGRSERTRALARALYEPIYSKWFRTEWEGLEKIPTEGGALLVANHAGAIPSDAPVIMHGIEKELGRPVYGLADYFFRTVPVVGTLWARAGGVSARPANAYRLLKEQRQLALVFPEGTKGPSKSFTDRYQLRRFGRGGFVEIADAGRCPRHPHRRRRLGGGDAGRPAAARPWPRPSVSPTSRSRPTCWPSGPLGVVTPFPAKFKLRVLDPVRFDVPADQDRYSKSRIMEESEHIRSQLQEAVYDMLRDRRSVWFG